MEYPCLQTLCMSIPTHTFSINGGSEHGKLGKVTLQRHLCLTG
jgi:hypothetical protein